MNDLLATSYSNTYVLYSFLISVIGCFVGLLASDNIITKNGEVNRLNALSAGVGIGGVGVWAMHFMGMLAMKVDLARGFALVETLASLVAAVIATTFAVIYALKNRDELKKIILAGFALGMGVVVMHYLGMYGMRFGGYFQWDWNFVALSIFIAIAAATVALFLVTRAKSNLHRFGAALLMAVAVCAMHYTGMYAADIVCTTANRDVFPQLFGVVSSRNLPFLLAFATGGLLLLISFDQLYQIFSKKR
jgi:NO-binding membrane sensor protein with MHYT domain